MKPKHYLVLLSVGLLAGSFYPKHEYEYFLLLRWVVCLTAIFCAYLAHKTDKHFFLIVLSVVAILFNPIEKFTFEREIWLWINAFVAFLLLIQIGVKIKHYVILSGLCAVSYMSKIIYDDHQSTKLQVITEERNRVAEFKKHKDGAESGDPVAQYEFSKVLDDVSESKKWLELAAKNGNANACLELGKLYLEGESPYLKRELAIGYYTDAAKLNKSLNAQMILAEIYLKGEITPKDEKSAFELYQEAADSGYYRIHIELGKCYENGIGVKKDYSQAYKWYSKAIGSDSTQYSSNRDSIYHFIHPKIHDKKSVFYSRPESKSETASTHLDRITSKMTEAEIEEGKRMIDSDLYDAKWKNDTE